MIKLILRIIGKKRVIADVPMTLAKIQSSLLSLLPIDPVITKDQCLILSEKDNSGICFGDNALSLFRKRAILAFVSGKGRDDICFGEMQ